MGITGWANHMGVSLCVCIWCCLSPSGRVQGTPGSLPDSLALDRRAAQAHCLCPAPSRLLGTLPTAFRCPLAGLGLAKGLCLCSGAGGLWGCWIHF